jgi:hypothetical protein
MVLSAATTIQWPQFNCRVRGQEADFINVRSLPRMEKFAVVLLRIK